MKDNYTFVGNLFVDEIVNFISRMDEHEWKEETIRQNTFEVHKDTETILILWDIKTLFELKVGKKRKHFEEFSNFLPDLSKKLCDFYGEGKILRIILTKLKANSDIIPHRDGGIGLEKSHRIHIPIITNENVLFYINDERKNMKVGEIWEINNQQIHTVVNNSDEDRIHLILDYMVTH